MAIIHHGDKIKPLCCRFRGSLARGHSCNHNQNPRRRVLLVSIAATTGPAWSFRRKSGSLSLGYPSIPVRSSDPRRHLPYPLLHPSAKAPSLRTTLRRSTPNFRAVRSSSCRERTERKIQWFSSGDADTMTLLLGASACDAADDVPEIPRYSFWVMISGGVFGSGTSPAIAVGSVFGGERHHERSLNATTDVHGK